MARRKLDQLNRVRDLQELAAPPKQVERPTPGFWGALGWVVVWIFVCAGFFWLAIMFSLTLGDYFTRLYMPLPTNWNP